MSAQRMRWHVGMALLLLLLAMLPAQAAIERVSVDSSGVEANYWSYVPSISGDGRYAVFGTSASNLVPGDFNGKQDVFRHDRWTGLTELVSVSTMGTQGDDDATGFQISADGRYVAFASYATNMVAGDTNGQQDVFLRDMDLGVTTRVSLDSTGGQISGVSFCPSITAHGECVTFTSGAANVVPGISGNQVYLRRLTPGLESTECVSVTPLGGGANGYSGSACISADGTAVAFVSTASNIVPPDTNNKQDIFVRQLSPIVFTERISDPVLGGEADGDCWGSNTGSRFISATGEYVAFCTNATNIMPGDTNGWMDIYLYHRPSTDRTRLSLGPGGVEADRHCVLSGINADGQTVAFLTAATNLVADDYNGRSDIFLYHQGVAGLERVVQGPGQEGNADSSDGALSDDGSIVAFCSGSTNFVPNDFNGLVDTFVYVAAPTTRTLTAIDTVGVPGSTAHVPVELSDAAGLVGIQFDLSYDPTILGSPSVAAGALIAGNPDWTVVGNEVAPGLFRVVAYSNTATPLGAGGGTLVTISFTVNPAATAGQTSPLDVSAAMLSDDQAQPIPVTEVDGTFTVIAVSSYTIDPIASPQHGDSMHPLPFAITVRALDQNGLPATTYNGTALLSDLTGTITPATVTFVNGVGTVSVSIWHAHAADTITATESVNPAVSATSNPFQVMGAADPNGDGVVNIYDLVQAIRIALGIITVGPVEYAAADVNGDGTVNVQDVIKIQRIILGLEPCPAPVAKASPGQVAAVLALLAPTRAASIADGSEVVVPVTISQAAGVAGFDFALSYDRRKLTPVAVRAGALLAGKSDWSINAKLRGAPLTVLCFSSQLKPLSGSGTLVEVVFTRTAPGKIPPVRLVRSTVASAKGESLPARLRLQ